MKTTAPAPKTTAPAPKTPTEPKAPNLADVARAVESAAAEAQRGLCMPPWTDLSDELETTQAAERRAQVAQTIQAARVASAEAAVAAAQAVLVAERQRAAQAAELVRQAGETARGLAAVVEARRAKADAEMRSLGF